MLAWCCGYVSKCSYYKSRDSLNLFNNYPQGGVRLISQKETLGLRLLTEAMV
jgi:hypothetical protein